MEGGTGMKAVVNEDRCIGCALCSDTCPEVFAILDDGYAHPIVEPIPHEEYDCVQEASEICPFEAITVVAD
jgi:ferredoxin